MQAWGSVYTRSLVPTMTMTLSLLVRQDVEHMHMASRVLWTWVQSVYHIILNNYNIMT